MLKKIRSARIMITNSPEFGVFMPIANGGWIISTTRPPVNASYALNRQVAVLADELGLDFIMSMAKWRGYGGITNHWRDSMESIVLMSALAEATKRVKIYCTMHTLMHNPAVAAKMVTTLDHVSGGRAGLNVVAGAYQGEFEQMGLWRQELDHDQRYELAREWLRVVKQLWSEDHVNFDGRYFHMKDCEMHPKPMSRPRPFLVCAGMSDVGMRFSANEADACFIGGRDEAEIAAVSRRAKAIAAEDGKTLKTFAMYTIVPGATDAAAAARAQHYIDGVDTEAVRGMMRSYGLLDDGRENAMIARSKQAFMSSKLVGSCDSITRQIIDTIHTAQIDGMMLIFPDFVADLQVFGTQILPQVRTALAQ
jgi:pyrimidine oxygenase